jgi:hypothetical protein
MKSAADLAPLAAHNSEKCLDEDEGAEVPCSLCQMCAEVIAEAQSDALEAAAKMAGHEPPCQREPRCPYCNRIGCWYCGAAEAILALIPKSEGER